MAKRRNDTDSFTSVLRGTESAAGAAGAGGAVDRDATERFGWGAAPPVAAAAAEERDDFAWLEPSDPGAEAHPGYGGYTTAVEPVPETILARTRPHARRLTLPVLVLFATAAAYGYFGGRLPEEWQNWATLAAASALTFFGVLLPFFAWLGHRYTVTTRRIIARTGILVRHRQDVYLARVSDVRLRRGPLQAMAGSGDIRV
ncbi:MAG: PH domain-containing protein, partial [Herbiconiux sp.]|nr:PH domain-containing protein [Herbiconiux sp.]